EGFQFFGFALAHYYLLGGHVPGKTNVWELFRGNQIPLPGGSGGIGTPEQVRDAMHQFEEAGVDQTVFIQQGGNNRHEDICASLELFAARVMPEFKERHAARERRKAEELAPHVERALALGMILHELEANGRPILPEKGPKPKAVLISLRDYSERFVDGAAAAERERLAEEILALRSRARRSRRTSVEVVRELRGTL